MLSAHFSIPQVFLIMAVANGLVAIYIGKLLPRIRAKPEA
jgi:hypothetical protein